MQSTDEQKIITAHGHGHAIVSAAPGSGKTTTMVDYVAHQLSEGLLHPGNLLVLMFNASTSKDFKDKLEKQGVPRPDKMGIYTYHAMALRLCNFFKDKGLIKPFNFEPKEWVLRTSARNSLIKVFGQAQFNQRKTELVDNFLSLVDFHKSGFLSPKEVFELLKFKSGDSKLLDAYELFENDRKGSRTLYFSDLLTEVVHALKTNDQARQMASNLKDRIIIDEFQDANPVQYELVKLLAGQRGQLMVVGDIDQSIYEWRGADPQIMLHQVAKDFQGAQMYTLSKTFRYGPDLALLTKRLIKNNEDRFDQYCEPFDENHEMDISINSVPAEEEPELIVSHIQEQLKKGRKLKDIAVLCRTYGSVGGVEMELLTKGIPAIIPKESSILVSREMNIIMAAAKLASVFERNQDPKRSWEEAITRNKDDLRTIMEYTKLNFLGLGYRDQFMDILFKENPDALDPDTFVRSSYFSLHPLCQDLCQAKKGKMDILKGVTFDLRLSMEYTARANTLNRQIERVMNGLDIQRFLEGRSMTATDVDTSKRRIDAIKKYIKHHNLDAMEFVDNVEKLRSQQENTQTVVDGILLSSVHKAKGLEWPVIIMPSMEDGLFPYKPDGAHLTKPEMESERRLAYVAATRAKDELMIYCPRDINFDKYMAAGGSGRRRPESEVSAFLWEMTEKHEDLKLRYVIANDPTSQPKKTWADYTNRTQA